MYSKCSFVCNISLAAEKKINFHEYNMELNKKNIVFNVFIVCSTFIYDV